MLKSQQIKITMICMYYLNATCRPGHHHNAFMLTGTIGQFHVQIRVVLLATWAVFGLDRCLEIIIMINGRPQIIHITHLYYAHHFGHLYYAGIWALCVSLEPSFFFHIYCFNFCFNGKYIFNHKTKITKILLRLKIHWK